MKPHRSIGRRVAFAALWLAIGCALNIAFGWACANRTIDLSRSPWPVHVGDIAWRHRTSNLRLVPGTGFSWHSRGCDATVFTVLRPIPSMPGHEHQVMVEDDFFGLPMRSLAQWHVNVRPYEAHGSLEIDLSSMEPLSFPLIPLWPGFALDSVFYGPLAWGLWQVPWALSRRRRRRRGLCVRCGYNLKGLTPGAACSECGRPSALTVAI